MKEFNKIILFLCVVLMAVILPCSSAYSLSTIITQEKLASLYGKIIKEGLHFSDTNLKISNFSCRPSQVVLPSGKVEYHPNLMGGAGKLGHRIIDLNVLVDGQLVDSIKMAGDVLLYGDVVSAVRTLKRNDIISRQDIEITRRNISMLGPGLVMDPDDLLGKQLRKTIRPGDIFFDSFIKPPQIIQRGDMVAIIADEGQLRLSVTGQAREAGALGDTIKVKNMMSRREVYGQILNKNEVVVSF